MIYFCKDKTLNKKIFKIAIIFCGVLFLFQFLTPIVFAEECDPGEIYTEVGCVPNGGGPIQFTPEIKNSSTLPPVGGHTSGEEAVSKSTHNAGIIATIVAHIVSFFAGVLEFTIKLSDGLIDLEGVKVGWGILLSITNLGFILAIIVIAFATILHIDSYEMKKTLWKLVVAALLVNFSLVITGIFIDMSNVVSGFILKRVGDTEFLSNALSRAMEIQKINIPADESSLLDKFKWITDPAGKLMSLYASLVFVTLFTVFILLIFATLAVMFLIRDIYLIILAIVSPIVWLLWIFPYTQKHWTKWWSELIRWNIFAPTALFFVYVAILIANGMSSETVTKSDAIIGLDGSLLVNSTFLQHGIKLTIILGFIVGGMIAANNFSIAGSGFAINRAKMMKNGAKGWSKRLKGAPFALPKEKPGLIGRNIQRIPFVGAAYNKTRDWRKSVDDKVRKSKIGEKLGKTYVGKTVNEWGSEYRKGKGLLSSVFGGEGLFKSEIRKKLKEEKEKEIKELFDEKKNIETTLKIFEKNPNLTPEDLESKKNMEEKAKEVDEKIMEIYRERAKKINKKDETKKSKKRKKGDIIAEREATIKDVGEIEDRLKKIYATGIKTPADKKEMDELESKKQGLENKISNLEKEANSNA